MKRTHPAWRTGSRKRSEDRAYAKMRAAQGRKGTRAPEGYALQDGCHNCAFVFVMSDYDSGEYFYCTCDAPKRPLCGSVGMKEHIFHRPEESDLSRIERDRRGTDRMLAWDTWSGGREVDPAGKCPRHERGEQ